MILAAIVLAVVWHVDWYLLLGTLLGLYFCRDRGVGGVVAKESLEAPVLVIAILLDARLGAGFLLGAWYGRYYYDGAECTGERRWPDFVWLPLWATMRDWYRHRAVRVPPLGGAPASPLPRIAIYGCHPHGMLALSAAFTFLVPQRGVLLTPVRLATHSLHTALPGLRELMLWAGCVDVTEEAILSTLSYDRSVALVPGGVREMGAPLRPAHERSEGFLRIAHGIDCPVVPVFLGGERHVCHVWHNEPRWLTRVRAWCARRHRCRFPFPTFFWPRWPSDVPALETRFGEPVDPRAYKTLDAFAAAYWQELARISNGEIAAPPPPPPSQH